MISVCVPNFVPGTPTGTWASMDDVDTWGFLTQYRDTLSAGLVPSLPTMGLVFYAPLESDQSTAETGQTINKYGSVSFSDSSAVFNDSGTLYFDIGSSASTGTNGVTLSVWFKGETFGYDQILFGYGTSPESSSGESIFLFCSRSALVMSVTGDLGGSPAVTGNTSVMDNAWHHIAATYDGNTATLYIDGNLNASGTLTLDIGATTGGIGGAWWRASRYLKGNVKAARIYNRALSAAEIGTLSTEF